MRVKWHRQLNAYLRARHTRHIEANVYDVLVTKGNSAGGIPGVIPVRFVMSTGGPGRVPVVRLGDRADIDSIGSMLRGRLESDVPPYLNEQRQLRIYGDSETLHP